MKFNKFTGGMNTLDPPEDILPNELESLVNACYDEERRRGAHSCDPGTDSANTCQPLLSGRCIRFM